MAFNRTFSSARKIRGQGMTEYIIIVALIAIASIGVYSAFGNVVKGQTGAMAAELGGQDGNKSAELSKTHATEASSRGSSKHTLENFQEAARKGSSGK